TDFTAAALERRIALLGAPLERIGCIDASRFVFSQTELLFPPMHAVMCSRFQLGLVQEDSLQGLLLERGLSLQLTAPLGAEVLVELCRRNLVNRYLKTTS